MNFRRALGISAVSNAISFALSFISVIVVSRLLTPTEIGIFSVAVSVLGISHAFREFGVGQYLVQAKTVGKHELRAAFSITLFFSWTIAAILYLSRHALADFYSHPGIADVLTLLAFNFLIMPFGTPLLALLQRNLEFGRLAIVRISNSAISTVVTIGTAWAGESYLSMAWGAIAGHLSNVVLLNFMRPGQIFMLPTLSGLGRVFRFGSLATVSTLLNELGSSMPDLILGRTLGFSAVAFYSRAYGLRKMLLGQILTLVRGVHFPSFAKGLRDGKDPAELYTNVMVHLVAVTAPPMALAALLAEPLILFLFGPQWERAAFLAMLICAFAAITTPYTMAPPSLVASGHIKLILPVQIATESVRALVFLSSIWLPLEQVVAGLAVVSIVNNVLLQAALKKAFNLGFVMFMTRLYSSFALIAFTLFGPALVILFDQGSTKTAIHHFVVLALSGTLAFVGWLLGIRITNHPIRNEIALIAAGIKNRLPGIRKQP